MKKVSVRPLFVGISCALCVLLSGFSSDKFPIPVTRTGLANAQVVQVDSCMIIYGINSATQSFTVEMYDPQLKLVHQFSEKISGFVPYKAALQYQSETRLEFVITDNYNVKQQYIFLDKELTAFYKSTAAPVITVLTSSSVKILDNFRIDDYEWEIRTETLEIGWSGRVLATSLYQYAIKLSPTWPMREVNRSIVLDSSAVEYAKVFMVRDNKIYVYVNKSTYSGGQFIYCISGFDGSLIYKRRLDVQYDTKKEEGGVIPLHTKSCIFSNAVWNEKLNKLMIAGTWMTDSAQESGLFLIMLNEDGTINSSIADRGYFLTHPVEYQSSTGMVGHAVAVRTYQCVRSMQYLPNGDFVVLSELYGMKLASKKSNASDLHYVDNSYHYFCVEAQFYDVTDGTIKQRKPEEFATPITWSANHHLDSITGFVPKQTRLYDKQYTNEVNLICSGVLAGPYYQVAFFTGKSSDVKLLSRNDVAVSPSQNTTAYFSKIESAARKVNCVAFLSPNPIHEQSFSEQNDFFAIDAQRLYGVTRLKDGFTIKVMAW